MSCGYLLHDAGILKWKAQRISINVSDREIPNALIDFAGLNGVDFQCNISRITLTVTQFEVPAML